MRHTKFGFLVLAGSASMAGCHTVDLSDAATSYTAARVAEGSLLIERHDPIPQTSLSRKERNRPTRHTGPTDNASDEPNRAGLRGRPRGRRLCCQWGNEAGLVTERRAYLFNRGQAAVVVSDTPKQSELFSDDHGHPSAIMQLIVSYCHFATIYQRTPVGLRVFLSVYRGFRSFSKEGGGTFRGWLRTVTRNTVCGLYRRRGMQPAAIGGSSADKRLQALPEGLQDASEQSLEVGPSRVEGHYGHHAIAFDADGRYACFTNPGAGTLVVLDLQSLKPAATFAVGGVPTAIVAWGGREESH